MKKSIPIVLLMLVLAAALLYYFYTKGFFGDTTGTGTDDAQKEVAHDESTDLSIQEYTLRERIKMATQRFPGDTLELMEFILKNYDPGTYLLDVDKTFSTNTPRSAVIYGKSKDSLDIYALIARSKKDDERTVEIKNLIGYDASFIDFDSTELGTAYFFLNHYKYAGGTFSKVWEAPVPTHGGFNMLTMETWDKKKIPYIKIRFYDAEDIGHIDYNYFFVGGIDSMPHLVASYEGINARRSLTDLNNDRYPDYFEYVYFDTGREIVVADSVPFVFRDSVYVNTRNPKQKRKFYDLDFEKLNNK